VVSCGNFTRRPVIVYVQVRDLVENDHLVTLDEEIGVVWNK
jgi:phosphohistidine swiveling domain-containing protein